MTQQPRAFSISLRRLLPVFVLASLLISIIPASGSIGGQIDYGNSRIVPIFTNPRDPQISFSGFLYSPRIIFTAGHAPLNAGNYVGTPNSKVDQNLKFVKVIKKIIAPQYQRDPGLRDFAIYILEKDLAKVDPFPLMTKEIETKLIAQNSKVQVHGYGIYRHQQEFNCALAFNPRSCNEEMNRRSAEPRMVELTAHASDEFQKLVGYTRNQIKDHFLMFSGPNRGPCGGDSGGSITAEFDGKIYYVGPTPNGMNVAACGGGDSDGTGGIHYSSQIYYHLDILKEAEEFILNNPQSSAIIKTIICKKGVTRQKISGEAPKCPAGFKRKR